MRQRRFWSGLTAGFRGRLARLCSPPSIGEPHVLEPGGLQARARLFGKRVRPDFSPAERASCANEGAVQHRASVAGTLDNRDPRDDEAPGALPDARPIACECAADNSARVVDKFRGEETTLDVGQVPMPPLHDAPGLPNGTVGDPHLRAPQCEGPARSGPALLGRVLRAILPCRPVGGACVGDLRSVDVVEPTEDGSFRVRHAHCQRVESQCTSQLLVPFERAERLRDGAHHDRKNRGRAANENDCFEKAHDWAQWAA